MPAINPDDWPCQYPWQLTPCLPWQLTDLPRRVALPGTWRAVAQAPDTSDTFCGLAGDGALYCGAPDFSGADGAGFASLTKLYSNPALVKLTRWVRWAGVGVQGAVGRRVFVWGGGRAQVVGWRCQPSPHPRRQPPPPPSRTHSDGLCAVDIQGRAFCNDGTGQYVQLPGYGAYPGTWRSLSSAWGVVCGTLMQVRACVRAWGAVASPPHPDLGGKPLLPLSHRPPARPPTHPPHPPHPCTRVRAHAGRAMR